MADKPSLRFADGGSLITRWAHSVTRPDATADRLRQVGAPTPTPAGIRFQDGGVVPGKGKGDKIPAKYEPGEFIVSNDMIDDNPGLREELSSLRAETLARRGKTVAEADAGVVTPRGLRAADGFDPFDRMARTLTGRNALPPRSPMGTMAQDLGRGPIGAAPAQPPAQGPVQGPTNPNVGQGRPSAEARAWQQGRAAPAAAPAAPAPAAAPSPAKPAGRFGVLRNAGAAVFNNPVTRTLLSAPAGVAMAGLTPTTLADGTLPQSVLDAMKKPYDPNMPPGDYSNPQPAARPTARPVAAPTTPAAPTNYRGKGYDDPRRIDMDPSRRSLGDSRDLSGELAGLPGKMPSGMREGMIYKTTDENGRTVYSGTNVREGAGFVDGRGANIGSRGAVNVVPGMSQAEIDAGLTNPDGSRWTARDNAIMAANLRDGVDPYRGTSRGTAAASGNQFQVPQNELYDGGGFGLLSNRAANERRLKMAAERFEPGARAALRAFYEGEKEHRKNQAAAQQAAMSEAGALRRAAMSDDTTRRGQDMDLQGRRLDAQGRVAAENAKLQRDAALREVQARIFDEAGQDPAAARDMALRYGFSDMAKSFDQLATSEQSRAKAASERGVSRLESRAVDEDGNISEGAKAIVRAQANSMAPGYETMPPHEQDRRAREVLAGIDVMDGMNRTRDPSFLNMIGNTVGLAGRSDRITSLPELEGARAEKVGFWEGTTTARVGKGDMKLLLPDGTVRYIPRSKVDQNTKELLRARGVIFKD